MPNWCMNELTVSGDAEELKRFVFATQGLPAKYPPQEWEKSFPREEPKDAFFCFNALIPTPEAVLQIGYDGHNKLPKDALRYALTGRPFEPIDGVSLEHSELGYEMGRLSRSAHTGGYGMAGRL